MYFDGNLLLNPSFLIISAVWFTSEIILAWKKVLLAGVKSRDSSSLTIIWTTVVLFISMGVYVSLGGSGVIKNQRTAFYFFGLGLIVLGIVFRWIAIFKLKKYFTLNVSIQRNHRVVNTGIYRYIRYPAYLGSLLSFAGLGFALLNWISLVIIFLPILGSFLNRISIEEKVLTAEFGEEYLEYSKNTKRLIPLIY